MRREVLPPGLVVTADSYTVTGGDITTELTRITAHATGMWGELELSAQGFASRVRAFFGAKDLELGDGPFDRRIFVQASDPALARAWLGDDVRRAIMATATDYTFVLRNREIKAQRVDLEPDADALSRAMHAVAALASAGKTLIDRWRLVAETLGATIAGDAFVPGETRFTGEHLGRPISVELDPPGVRLTRAVRAPRCEFAGGAPLPGRLGADPRWRAIQPARLRCDGEVATLSWDGYIPDLERITNAAALLAALEAEPAGPYR